MKKEEIAPPSDKTMAIGAAWSMMSFVVLAITGLLFNILIARIFGPEAVGIFNQVYSVYIIISMISTFGIQLSSLHYVSKNVDDLYTLKQIITSALLLTAGISLIVALISLAGAPLLSWILSSENVGRAFLWILPGIIFFAMNKVLLNTTNGLFKIRALNIFQSLRFVLAILLLGLIICIDLPVTATPGCLSGAEFILFLLLVVFLRKYFGPLNRNQFRHWREKHLRFGVKSVLGGVVSEANTRVDIFMLGIFLSDSIVGIYSIAALVIEGIAKFVDFLRFPINPYLSYEIAHGRIVKLCQLIRRGVKVSYLLVISICIVALATYHLLPAYIIKNPAFNQSWTPFVILAIGLMFGGGYRPFKLLLSQAGFPGYQTLLQVLILSSNIILNFFFIRMFGYNGAAIATAITFILYVVYLKILVRLTLKKWI
ncbi:oligosaccharide flippase family protein [Thermodesulfobacteriota bacterium]